MGLTFGLALLLVSVVCDLMRLSLICLMTVWVLGLKGLVITIWITLPIGNLLKLLARQVLVMQVGTFLVLRVLWMSRVLTTRWVMQTVPTG